MENYKLVLPEHLNHYGFLFGGHLLKWIDEVGYIAVTLDYPGRNFVTVAMDKVEFRKSIRNGTILAFVTEQKHKGNTAVDYSVKAYTEKIENGIREMAFSTNITFVAVDSEGHKQPI